MGSAGEPEQGAGPDQGMLGALGEGPARLSHDDVAASQRRRMLAAMVAAVAEKGYTNVVVADVVSRARVSRATFYEHFTDKGDCFVAAFHAAADDLVGTIRSRMSSTRRAPRERLHVFLESYLTGLAAFPEGARVCLVEIYAVGAEAVLHRQQIQLDFVGFLRGIHTELVAAGEPVRSLSDFDFEALVAAISSLVTNRVAADNAAELAGLREPFERFVLTHFGLEG